MENFDSIKLTERVWAAVRGEPRVDVFRDSIRGIVDKTTATLEGQVGNISVKRHILNRIAALPELTGLVDRLHVMPFTRMDDRQIGAMVLDALSLEPTMAKCVLQRRRSCEIEIARKVRRHCGRIAVDVYDGVVTLDGEVPSLAHKQLAGVLAWWVPGSRDVVNDLVETARENDLDAALAETVGMVLNRDASIDASQLRISVRNAVVRLHGSVPSKPQVEMAEFDAWYVFGVEGVENGIRTHT
jgi:osmotically-inducible protein OsmY